MKQIFILAIVLLSNISFAQDTIKKPLSAEDSLRVKFLGDQIRAHASVYKILSKKTSATCFALNYYGVQYMVTVRHISPFKQYKTGDKVSFRLATDYGDTLVNGVCYMDNTGVLDIVMIKCENFISENAFEYDRNHSVLYGNPFELLGFPEDMNENHRPHKLFNENFPFPFLTKANASSGDMCNLEVIIYLDGIMVDGMEGAPVFNYQKKKLMLTGIILGDLSDKKLNTFSCKNDSRLKSRGLIKSLSVICFENIIPRP